MITGERCEDKLAALRRLDVCNVVSRGAGPAGFGPEAKTFAPLECHAREATSLIVSVVALPGVFSFQQLHHRRGACGVRDFSSDDVHHQTCGGVSRQLVTVLAVWPARDTLATVCILAKRLLIHVDVCVAEP